jgi:hypothetical protein
VFTLEIVIFPSGVALGKYDFARVNILHISLFDQSNFDISRINIIEWNKYRLIHGQFHIGLVIIPRPPYWPEIESRANMGLGMITRPIWKCPCIKLFITYF